MASTNSRVLTTYLAEAKRGSVICSYKQGLRRGAAVQADVKLDALRYFVDAIILTSKKIKETGDGPGAGSRLGR